MKRRSVLLTAIMLVLLAACSHEIDVSEQTENSPSVTVLPEETTISEEVIDTGVSEETELTEESIEHHQLTLTNDSVFLDEDYFKLKTSSEQKDLIYTNRGDSSFRDELQDEILLDDANAYFDEGYIVTSAEQLNTQGVGIGIDNEHYLYRGFAAIYIAEEPMEVSDLIYEYIMPESVFDTIIEPYMQYPYEKQQQGTKMVYTFDSSLYITYDTTTEVMYYSTVPQS